MTTYYYIGTPDGHLMVTEDRNHTHGVHAFWRMEDAFEEAKRALIKWCTTKDGLDQDTLIIYRLHDVGEVCLTAHPEVTCTDYSNADSPEARP